MSFWLEFDNNSDMRVDCSTWTKMLKLANKYGWEPTGTSFYEHTGDDTPVFKEGSYQPVAIQYIFPKDTANMATALEKGICAEKKSIDTYTYNMSKDFIKAALQGGCYLSN